MNKHPQENATLGAHVLINRHNKLWSVNKRPNDLFPDETRVSRHSTLQMGAVSHDTSASLIQHSLESTSMILLVAGFCSRSGADDIRLFAVGPCD